ncbi:MAG TPA: Fe-S cluster assembly protein SufD [Alphaproteobacteria bacterium]|nr:Fe-S cluster assembly protein SufD [Alphaproteobacteria bacterium]
MVAVAHPTALRPAPAFGEAFARVRGTLPGARTTALSRAREEAFARFVRVGVPTSRIEEWKYTNLAPLAASPFRLAEPGRAEIRQSEVAHFRMAGLCEHLLVFVNGRFRPDLSDPDIADDGALPKGITVSPLSTAAEPELGTVASALADSEEYPALALEALNGAFATDGALIEIGAGAKLDRPLHLLFLFDTLPVPPAVGGAQFLRTLIVAEEGSEATIVEGYGTLGPAAPGAWTNAVTEIHVGRGAKLRHYKMQIEDHQAAHTSSTVATLTADAEYNHFVLASGGHLARQEVRVNIAGRNAKTNVRGLTLARGHQHIEHRTDIHHDAEGACSNQFFKTAVTGRAHGVFQGKIEVAPGAQKTDARQNSRNLLLSDRAVADSKPELIINADDVMCSHGSATGDLDPNEVFYLRSRGLDDAEARALLVEAFAADLIDAISEEPVRGHFRNQFARWLDAGLEA